jgi:hypothetical protein
MSTKRYFRIIPSSYGGEITIGSLSQEFADYWLGRDSDELLEHVCVLDEGEDGEGYDPESPPVKPDWEGAWYDCDDLVHIHVPSTSGSSCFAEIKLHSDATYEQGGIRWLDVNRDGDVYDMFDVIGDDEEFERSCVVSNRDVMTSQDPDSEPGLIPALCVIAYEKGDFGQLVVETDADGFDPSKFKVAVIETDFGDFAERFWYGETELQGSDGGDSVGKGMEAVIGFVQPERFKEASDEAIAEMFREPDAD